MEQNVASATARDAQWTLADPGCGQALEEAARGHAIDPRQTACCQCH
jgi:hypothetical protein